MINDKQQEILVIAQEEAAEVIQEISKIFRFGIDSQHRDGMSHRAKLEDELGDFLCMVDLMIEQEIVHAKSLTLAKLAKREKLKQYSSIFQ